MITIKIDGLEEIRDRFKQAPRKYGAAMEIAMNAALLELWSAIPGYPSPPSGSTYRRTETLGRSIGSTVSGGKAGQPQIYENRMEGRYRVGEFGTRLNYAPYVIGENQAWMHKGRWWTLVEVAKGAVPKIQAIFDTMAEELARWLDGK